MRFAGPRPSRQLGTKIDALPGMNIEAMRETTLDQVPEACAKLYQCGLAALERNEAESAMVSFTTALGIDPGFVACREALRAAQKKAGEKRTGLLQKIKSCFSPSLIEGEALLHFKPLKAMSMAERVLNQDPGNATAHKLLAKAALALNLPRTALLSLNALANEHPENRSIKLALANALAKSGETGMAATLYGQLLKDNPRDKAALRGLRKIPAGLVGTPAIPPANDGTAPAQAGPAPVVAPPPLRPKNAPVAAAPSEEAIIRRFEPLLEHCPRNSRILKTLAEAYARKQLFDKSLSYYRRALQAEGGKDEAIEKAISEMTLKRFDAELGRLDPKAPDYAAQREKIENRRLEFQWHEMEMAH
jgi:cytochrome c-type biogenesis protein CcmH/NrfG